MSSLTTINNGIFYQNFRENYDKSFTKSTPFFSSYNNDFGDFNMYLFKKYYKKGMPKLKFGHAFLE